MLGVEKLMCMDCFNTLNEINRQRLDIQKTRDYENRKHCGNCQDWTVDKDFNVFGMCSRGGLPKGRNHVCVEWVKK